MAKLLGFILLIASAFLLFFGWETHPATSRQLVWLPALGAVVLVWGLFVRPPRRVFCRGGSA